MPRTLTLTACCTLAVAGLTLAACGGDDEGVSVPGATLGESASDATSSPSLGGQDLGNELGSCHVNVTGDITADWTAPGGSAAVGYGPWIPPMPDATLGIDIDETFFILNCGGDDDENYVGFMPLNSAAIPMQPATYTIPAATNMIGTGDGNGMSVLITFEGTDTNWGASGEGTLVITEFDDEHIAGTFMVPVTDVLAEMSGEPSEGNAVVSGEFDFANPN